MCYSGKCDNASLAIDGDWNTYSRTAKTTGTHWWQVSMPNTLVYQIVLVADTGYSDEITVSLYNGETLAGQCKSYTGGTQTLSCDRVAADRVRLTVTSTSRIYLYVFEIKVTGASTKTIGM